MGGGYGLGEHDGSEDLLVFGEYLFSNGISVREDVGDLRPPWDILRLWLAAILEFELCVEISFIGVFRREENGDKCLVA